MADTVKVKILYDQRVLMPLANVWKAYDQWCVFKKVKLTDVDSRRAEYLTFVTEPGDRIEVASDRQCSMSPRTANRVSALMSPHGYALYKVMANLP